MINIYEQLKPEIQKQLDKSAEEYNSVSTVKYTLMSKSNWSDLRIDSINNLILFTSIDPRDLGINSVLYGNNIIE